MTDIPENACASIAREVANFIPAEVTQKELFFLKHQQASRDIILEAFRINIDALEEGDFIHRARISVLY